MPYGIKPYGSEPYGAAAVPAPGPITYAQGLDFRATAAFVTDPTDCTYEIGLTTNYPRTTPQGNVVGWESSASTGNYVGSRDRVSTVDPRLAGIELYPNSSSAPHSAIYRIDLPAPGTYEITLAIGDAQYPETLGFVELLDEATPLFVLQGVSLSAGQFYDATGVLRTSAADWVANNAKLTITMRSTILRIKIGTDSATTSSSLISHIFVQAVSSGPIPLALSACIRAFSATQGALAAIAAMQFKAKGTSTSQAPLGATAALKVNIKQVSSTQGSLGARAALKVQARQVSSARAKVGSAVALATQIRVVSRIRSIVSTGSILNLQWTSYAISRMTFAVKGTTALSTQIRQTSRTQLGIKATTRLGAQMRATSQARGVISSVASLAARLFGFSWIKNNLKQGGIATPAQCIVGDTPLYLVALNDNELYSVALSDEVVNA